MHNQETAFVVIVAATVYSNDKVLAGSKSGAKPYHCLLNSICSPQWWTVQPREYLKSTQQSFGFRLNRRKEVPHPLYSDIGVKEVCEVRCCTSEIRRKGGEGGGSA